MKNQYETRGDMTIVFVAHRDGTTTEFVIDTEDLEKIKSNRHKLVPQ